MSKKIKELEKRIDDLERELNIGYRPFNYERSKISILNDLVKKFNLLVDKLGLSKELHISTSKNNYSLPFDEKPDKILEIDKIKFIEEYLNIELKETPANKKYIKVKENKK